MSSRTKSDIVNGDRLRHARELVGLTQTELAAAIDVNQATLAKYEKGLLQPSPEMVSAISDVTECAPSYFYREFAPKVEHGSLLFRAKASATRKSVYAAKANAELALDFALHLLEKVNAPALRIRPIEGSPEEAANEVRRLIGVGASEPIKHLTRGFERLGGIVLAMPPIDRCEAFATWYNDLPLIAIDTTLVGDRYRMTLAHEWGHLVLHHGRAASGALEDDAYLFAAELLMPRKAVLNDLSTVRGLKGFGVLKRKWGVSIQALIRRAYQLDHITERQYRYLFQQLSALGWRTAEPSEFDIPRERPRLLRKMAEVAYGQPINFTRMAADMSVKPQTASSLMFKYADVKDIGQSNSTRSAKVIPMKRPKGGR